MAFKKLLEKRADIEAEMALMLTKAETEERAFTEEEQNQFDSMEAEIRAIDATVERAGKARKVEINKVEETEERASEDVAVVEERAFANYIRGIVETRDASNLADGSQGKVMPHTVAQRVIAKVKEISPIVQMADLYEVGGTVSIPYYDESADKITVAYATEFSALTSHAGQMTSIDLKGFLAGALAKVSKSLVNNMTFDVVGFVVNHMAEDIVAFIEGEAINGTTNKITGMSNATQVVTTSSNSAITADELIDVQEQVPDRYTNCVWIMNKATRTAIRKLKDGDGNYLLNKDANARWGYTLFGKDVYVSDNAPTIAANAKVVFYGDLSGLALQLGNSIELEVLREKYADEHAIGVVGFIEADAKIADQQKIAVLKMHA